MRKLIVLTFAALLCNGLMAQAYNPNYGSNNPVNSQYNPNNTQYNPRNSSYNPDNSPDNPSVYDNRGNRIGYEVQAPSGVKNLFDNHGNRVGYVPSQR